MFGCRAFTLALLMPAVALAAGTAGPSAHHANSPPVPPLFASPTQPDRVGRITVPVMIDGKGPFRFLVDTGADSSMVSPALVRQLGLIPRHSAYEQVQGTTGSQRLPWVRIATLRVGRIVKTDLRLPISQTRVISGLAGILGLAGFGPVRVVVDFRHDRVQINRSSNAFMWGYLDIRAKRTTGGLLMIPAHVARVPVEAVIDTGASETIGNAALRTALLNSAKKAIKAHVYGVTKQISNGGLVASPTIYLGPAVIRNLSIVYSDVPIFKTWHLESRPALIIGMNVLGTVSALVLDYPHARVYLLPPSQTSNSISEQEIYSPSIINDD